MKQIRYGVFETNSSSMHSLTVMKRDSKYTPEEILDGFYLWDDKETGEEDCVWPIRYYDLEFGRSPFRALGTFKEKWLYACASLVREYNDDVYKELVRIALKYVPGLKKIELPMGDDGRIADKGDIRFADDDYYQQYGKTEDELVDYLKAKEELWGFEIEYRKDSYGYWRYNKIITGYVDENILGGFLDKERITLEEYLTNKKYVVIQDGDEYGYWHDMKKTGLINMDIIDHEYPKED